ncbi:MAG: GSCFA domain-containing protein [Bacteroidia bacterium]|nr:GSCFA domain-containing protein [Bacteroidia bacterium]
MAALRFRTELPRPGGLPAITHGTRVVAMGSCFADRIGGLLAGAKIPALVNPLGLAFNPISLCRLLDAGLGTAPLMPWQWAAHSGLWHSFDLHSRFSDPDPAAAQARLDEALGMLAAWLPRTDVLILTFGTAVTHRLLPAEAVVNNCHTYPAAAFRTALHDPAALYSQMRETLGRLHALRPELQVMLSVSPVRYLREGMQQNSLSKAVLRVLCHQLCEADPRICYFPAWELMMDDLRDYRYYQDDLIHPSDAAVRYIWEYVAEACFPPDTRALIARWERVQRDLAHRPMHPDPERHRAFLLQVQAQLLELHPLLGCEAELAEVAARLAGP